MSSHVAATRFQVPEIFELDGYPIHTQGRDIYELDGAPLRVTPERKRFLEPVYRAQDPTTRDTLIEMADDEEARLIPLQTQHRSDNEIDGLAAEHDFSDSVEDEITIDISSLDASFLPSAYPSNPESSASAQPQILQDDRGQETSYYFPEDPSQPSWRPIALRAPYICALASVSFSFAAIQEYLLRRSNRYGGILHFESLNDLSVMGYFLWRYFPTIVTVSYGLAYQMIDVQAKRIEPYYRLAQKSGATVDESLGIDGSSFWTWFRPPFPGSARTRISTVISLLGLAAIPIIQNASLDVVQPFNNTSFALHVQQGWSRSVTITFAFIGLLSLCLLYPLRRPTGLLSDPGGISGLLAMSTKSHVLSDFLYLDACSSDKAISDHLGNRRYILYKNDLWQGEYMRNRAPRTNLSTFPPKEHHFSLPLSQGLPYLTFILMLVALVPVFIFTAANVILEKVPFLMTAIGIAAKLLWTLFDTNVRLTEPYYHLVRRNAMPNTLTVDYTGTISLVLPFKAVKENHYTLAFVATNSILLEVLTVCLSSFGSKGANFMHRKSTAPTDNILEGDAETFTSFWISLVLSLLIIISLCATALFVHFQRSDITLPRKPGNLAFVFLITHQSKLLISWIDTEKFTNKNRENHLKNMNQRYGFGW